MTAADGDEGLRALSPERLVALERFHREEAKAKERVAKRHRVMALRVLDEIDRRVKARQAARK